MKKTTVLFTLFAIAVLLLAACGGAGDAANDNMADDNAAAADNDAAAADNDAADNDAADDDAAAADDDMAEGPMFMDMTLDEAAAAGYVVVAPGETVRIGASAALTGPIPEYGLDIAQGYQVAIADLNAAGGIAGHEFELDLQDGACDGDAATVVANGFAADDTILAVAGGTCSGETFGLSPILADATIPFVSASATNPAVTSEDCATCNRVILSDSLQAEVDANYIFNTLGLTKAAVMHDNSDYGLGLAELFQAAFEAVGGEVVSFDGVQVGDVDFRAALTQVATNEPELVFFGGYTYEGALITQQMLETGLEDVLFFSDDGVYGQAYIDTAGDAAEGMYVSAPAGDEVEDANAAFDATYEEMFGLLPDELGPFHAQAYDSVVMIAEALKSVAHEVDGYLVFDRAEVVAAVRGTSGLMGLTGEMTCDAIGNCGAGGIQIFQVVDGEFVQVSGFGLDE